MRLRDCKPQMEVGLLSATVAWEDPAGSVACYPEIPHGIATIMEVHGVYDRYPLLVQHENGQRGYIRKSDVDPAELYRSRAAYARSSISAANKLAALLTEQAGDLIVAVPRYPSFKSLTYLVGGGDWPYVIVMFSDSTLETLGVSGFDPSQADPLQKLGVRLIRKLKLTLKSGVFLPYAQSQMHGWAEDHHTAVPAIAIMINSSHASALLKGLGRTIEPVADAGPPTGVSQDVLEVLER